MKIAFVGKGGSGKSTIGALFVRSLVDSEQSVLAVDADINQHFAHLLGVQPRTGLSISETNNKLVIRQVLRGTNQKVTSAKRFVKTTPPGLGSHIIRITKTDPIIAAYATDFAKRSFFTQVGTYTKDGIGISCYHSDLAVFENVLSHTYTSKDEWLVADMVAGTDAFAGALHALFDAIFVVVEPTPESISVFRQFMELAQKAQVDARVCAIGNKLIDAEDEAYLTNALGDALVATIPNDAQLRKVRQRGQTITSVPETLSAPLIRIKRAAQQRSMDADDQLRRLHSLHRHFASQDFTIAKYGDLLGQIDENFSFKQAIKEENA